jgi:hypothetical protein
VGGGRGAQGSKKGKEKRRRLITSRIPRGGLTRVHEIRLGFVLPLKRRSETTAAAELLAHAPRPQFHDSPRLRVRLYGSGRVCGSAAAVAATVFCERAGEREARGERREARGEAEGAPCAAGAPQVSPRDRASSSSSSSSTPPPLSTAPRSLHPGSLSRHPVSPDSMPCGVFRDTFFL